MIRAEGQNLLSSSTSEFASHHKELAALGLRAMNQSEVEQNVLTQLTEETNAPERLRRTVRANMRVLDDKEQELLQDTWFLETCRLSVQEMLSKMPRNGTPNEEKQKLNLMVQIQYLNDLLPAPPQSQLPVQNIIAPLPPVPPPRQIVVVSPSLSHPKSRPLSSPPATTTTTVTKKSKQIVQPNTKKRRRDRSSSSSSHDTSSSSSSTIVKRPHSSRDMTHSHLMSDDSDSTDTASSSIIDSFIAQTHDDWDDDEFSKRLHHAIREELFWDATYTELTITNPATSPQLTAKEAETALLTHFEGFNDDDDDDSNTPPPTTTSSPSIELIPHNMLSIPCRLYYRLLPHQRDSMTWFWSLFAQNIGGLLGDEMGLGKTAQVIAFMDALRFSNRFPNLPALVVAPATTLVQWLNEYHRFAPHIRVFCLHPSFALYHTDEQVVLRHAFTLAQEQQQHDEHHTTTAIAIVTSYEFLRSHKDSFLERKWGLVVLDEGHRIRNPDANTTLTCKRLNSEIRFVLTGAPIQNKLEELWSIFDFLAPGKLGDLPSFRFSFEEPIRLGSHVTSTPLQIKTATARATVLKQTISPFLLRRLKSNTVLDMPKKTEQVLFCNLTSSQRDAYLALTNRRDVKEMIANARRGAPSSATRGQAFKVLMALQKICNHADLRTVAEENLLKKQAALVDSDDGDDDDNDNDDDSNNAAEKSPNRFHESKSGKMLVLDVIVNMWKEEHHKVLIFCQGTQMLDVLEMLCKRRAWKYYRMDGSTPVSKRQPMISAFNDPNNDVFLFLLTTRVGGVGTNLTGATRVVIFDPDWNPATDINARERAWRIGQTKPVTVYRLITSGTIEEKIYLRQMLKQFLADNVLIKPGQRRFIKKDNLASLLTLDGGGVLDETETETSEIFHGSKVKNNTSDAAKILETAVAINTQQQPPDSSLKPKTKTQSSGQSIIQQLFESGSGLALKQVVDHDVVEGAHVSSSSTHNDGGGGGDRRISKATRDKFLLQARAELARLPTRVNITQPTWTGKSGMAGAPPSSRDLLSRMRARAMWGSTGDTDSTTTPDSSLSSIMAIIIDLRTFLRSNREGTSSAQLVRQFDHRLNEGTKQLFKDGLKELAVFKDGLWKLKREYR